MNNKEKVNAVLHSFRELHRYYMRILWKETEALGTTVNQARAMKILKEHPKIGVLELAERLYLGKSTTSGMVERLIKSGFVESEVQKSDRRSKVLSLTPKGIHIQEKSHALFLEKMSILLDIPEQDLDHLLQTHQLIITKLKEREQHDEQ